MIQKSVVLVIDGLGDRPIKNFGYKTPLEAANTKNFDRFAQMAECGMMHILGRGIKPGSDVSHLAIFGYPPELYYFGRGPIEVAGLGIELKQGDVALRGNFATVDENWVIKDRRAGRIRVVEPFTNLLDGLEIDGVKFIVKPGTAHRAGVIMRGQNLSCKITDADPHDENLKVSCVQPKDESPEAQKTSEVLNRFLKKSYEILKNSELNKRKRQAGEPEANFLLVRGAGQYNEVPSFEKRYGLKACCIAGGGLYKGIGAYLGMDVKNILGATGLSDTDVEAKFKAVLEQLQRCDFVFVHVKATDSLGEDGDYTGKKEFIEKIDSALKVFSDLPTDTLLVITADHSTPCSLKSHSADPVPILFYGEGVRVDNVSHFNEIECTRGGLGFIEGKHIMPQILNLMGRLNLAGA